MAAWSAARQHGLDSPLSAPCVVVPPDRHIRRAGVVVLRDELPDSDVQFRGAALVTTVRRTVFDGLRLLGDQAAERWLDRALQQGWTTLDDLSHRVRWSCGRHGAPRLARLVAAAACGARSRAERILVGILRGCGIPGWRYNVRVTLPGRQTVVVDAALLDIRLAIEVDGRAWHTDVERFQRDRTRQNLLVAAGWTVLRFTWEDLCYRPDEVARRVRETVAALQPTCP
jgi:very-short-patch-repair endonuclease